MNSMTCIKCGRECAEELSEHTLMKSENLGCSVSALARSMIFCADCEPGGVSPKMRLTVIYLDASGMMLECDIEVRNERHAESLVERIFRDGLAFNSDDACWRNYIPASRIMRAYHKISAHPDFEETSHA